MFFSRPDSSVFPILRSTALSPSLPSTNPSQIPDASHAIIGVIFCGDRKPHRSHIQNIFYELAWHRTSQCGILQFTRIPSFLHCKCSILRRVVIIITWGLRCSCSRPCCAWRGRRRRSRSCPTWSRTGWPPSAAPRRRSARGTRICARCKTDYIVRNRSFLVGYFRNTVWLVYEVHVLLKKYWP